KKCFISYSCPNCSINLVYHKNKQNLLCHYCGYKTLLTRECSKEGKCDFIFSGPGVERISEEVKKIFPFKKTVIFSSDTMNKKNSSEILEKIINNKIQILIGTQLISKGFHFPNLNCIVVVDIDLLSQGHDLRGAEKNLQLYHQLSGRAGRAGKSATVYFQTYNLNTKMIVDITNKDPDIFLSKELEIRRENNLPPFQRFIALIITGNNERELEKESYKFKSFIENLVEGRVLGPVNAPIFRLKRKFRVRLLVRGRKSLKMQNSLAKAIQKFKFSRGMKLSVDVDPINFN
ncbi:primosomal protein N', partial [Candidatus Pelagibacter sp.]|nr:primosomal protein N' [Candidatus Pelagibacter sp.]